MSEDHRLQLPSLKDMADALRKRQVAFEKWLESTRECPLCDGHGRIPEKAE